MCVTHCVHQGWTRVAGRRHCWCTTGWDTGTHGIWGKRAVLPGAECGRGLRGAAGPRDRHECRSVQDILFLLRGGGRLGAQAAPRVPDVPHNRWRLLGLPQGASRELPLLLGVPGPPAGTRPTNQANLQRWLLLTASALFVLVLAISLVEALRKLQKQYCSSSAGSRIMGVQLAVDAFLAKRLAAVRALDPVACQAAQMYMYMKADAFTSQRLVTLSPTNSSSSRRPPPPALPPAARPRPAGAAPPAAGAAGRT